MGAMQALVDARVEIPTGISVVGFDDISMVRFMQPPLTTVAWPHYRMGLLAVRMLASIVKKKQRN